MGVFLSSPCQVVFIPYPIYQITQGPYAPWLIAEEGEAEVETHSIGFICPSNRCLAMAM